MNIHAAVRKTQKGEDEIQTRAHRLHHHLRFVLILVDGASTVEQIAAKCAGMRDVAASLAQLAEEGYVTIHGEHPPVVAPDGSQRDVGQVKMELIEVAKAVLGGAAGKVVSKIEAAPDTKEGLLEVTSQCKKMVRLVIDEAKAEELRARCAALLDTL